MFPTILSIPGKILGVNVFGAGWLLALWLIGSAIYLAWAWRRPESREDAKAFVLLAAVVAAVLYWITPLLLDDGRLPLRGFGLMVLLGIVFAHALAIRQAERMGVDPDHVYGVAFWLFLLGFGGARHFYVAQYWNHFTAYSETGDLLWGATLVNAGKFNEGGIVVYGGIIGGITAILLYCRNNKLPALAMSDMIAPSLLLALGFGRLGCLMNGCCYGAVCDRPWG
ncbi:MAG: prolipoprotein diacylglyceryl transferase, partial [Planctomycetales bacterium]